MLASDWARVLLALGLTLGLVSASWLLFLLSERRERRIPRSELTTSKHQAVLTPEDRLMIDRLLRELQIGS